MNDGTLYQTQIALHVVAISVWVGGQVVLAWLMPALRAAGSDAADGRRLVSITAQRFQVVSWAALALAVFTGIWMLLDPDIYESGDWARLFFEKMFMVVVAVGLAIAHSMWVGPKVREIGDSDPDRAKKFRAMSGAFGGIGLALSILALVWGVRLFFT